MDKTSICLPLKVCLRSFIFSVNHNIQLSMLLLSVILDSRKKKPKVWPTLWTTSCQKPSTLILCLRINTIMKQWCADIHPHRPVLFLKSQNNNQASLNILVKTVLLYVFICRPLPTFNRPWSKQADSADYGLLLLRLPNMVLLQQKHAKQPPFPFSCHWPTFLLKCWISIFSMNYLSILFPEQTARWAVWDVTKYSIYTTVC